MIGGSCINVACIPTKALVTSARAARQLRDASALGLTVEGGRVDVDLLRAHKQDVVEGMVAANRQQFLDSGLHLVIGEARFVGPRTVRVASPTAASATAARQRRGDQHGHPPAICRRARDGRGRGGSPATSCCSLDRLAGPAGGARRRHRRGGVRADVRVVRHPVTLVRAVAQAAHPRGPRRQRPVTRVFLDDGIDVRLGVRVDAGRPGGRTRRAPGDASTTAAR